MNNLQDQREVDSGVTILIVANEKTYHYRSAK